MQVKAESPAPAKPAKKADLKVRLVTGVAFAGVAVGLGLWGAPALLGLLLVVVLVAQGEFYLAARKGGYQPATALGLVAGATLLASAYFRGESAAPLVLTVTIGFAFVWHAWGRDKTRAMADLSVTLMGVAYIPLLASFAAALLHGHDGRGILLATVGAAAVYDIGAYAGGRTLGRHPLAPRISPGKTREGAMVASVVVVVATTLLAPLVGPWSIAQAVVFGGLVCVVAPLGDLFESVIKRDLGIKDMGAILPGHGGVLDRVDAILFCVPASYLSLRLLAR